ncbi:Na(+)/H(+) exchange regulatory cofactor NHE-RF3 [Thalassophryne amazonica]|uniref:Na(+)/H(+) exchange regulatory cofactor NHE-RF3 n=1 Tax=Thalassophryne amazonica TaxID=390379 RepID=UPI001470D21E|nr:Na(+)/H(+) exchange regulatory cofactor NHE-RF3 [Thalassophryne amazonica]
MSYKPRVIVLTKRPGQAFGFYLRVENGEEGHLVRCLEMGGPAELAGMKDGDRLIRVNGKFVDGLPHSQVVDQIRESGTTVSFHILDKASYEKAKAQGVDLSDGHATSVNNGLVKQPPKPKLCYLVKSSSGFGFSLRSARGEDGLFITELIPGCVAERAGVKADDRLLEINGESLEGASHEQAVDKIKAAGKKIMFLLADEETSRYYQNNYAKIGAWLATTKYLPYQPRIAAMTKGSDGYGFYLIERTKQTGHFISTIDRGSPAEIAGLHEMDRLVAVDGKEVDSYSHEKVVDMIRQSGTKCCLLVVDKDTDQMYKLGNVSPVIFWEEMQSSLSPPSYTEAINLPAPVQLSTTIDEREEELKPKLCRLEKTAAGFGFHLHGIQGIPNQCIKEIVKGGAADRAGLVDDDVVVEVNGVNVETSTHEEVVELIRSSGATLELLVAKKSVYNQLSAKGVGITRQLLGHMSSVQVHKVHTPEEMRQEENRADTPSAPARERAPSVSSSSSQESNDERL